MAHLFVVKSADFLFLMRRIGLTRGNLSSHMTKLENAGYLKVIKEFVGKKPHTMLKLTRKGRMVFEDYRTRMEQMITRLPENNVLTKL